VSAGGVSHLSFRAVSWSPVCPYHPTSHSSDALHLPNLKDNLTRLWLLDINSLRPSIAKVSEQLPPVLSPWSPLAFKMFNWLKRKKSATEEHELENTQPPKIRKPTHAARDARMSIPVGEREYYDILEARKRAASNASPSIGTSAMKGGKGKEKAGSPLAYNDSCECLLSPSRRQSQIL
jgi:hypothetical protein